MRCFVLPILALFLVVDTTNAQLAGGKELFEPTSGATVILPDNWVFTAGATQLVAFSDDKK